MTTSVLAQRCAAEGASTYMLCAARVHTQSGTPTSDEQVPETYLHDDALDYLNGLVHSPLTTRTFLLQRALIPPHVYDLPHIHAHVRAPTTTCSAHKRIWHHRVVEDFPQSHQTPTVRTVTLT